MAILMEFVLFSHKKRGHTSPQNSWQLSASILSTFSGFRLKLTFLCVYKLTRFLLVHEFHCGYPDGSPYIAEYKDTADAAQCGEHLMALPDHKPHKAFLSPLQGVVSLG
jgi:hypothetical protein